ncbi:MAG: hypothetical protein Q9196_002788 [Gyalolechia fulgens]
MQMIALRNDFTAFSRRTDAKIALLKEVIGRVQKGEEVDVRGLLGTGDPEKEKEWEQGQCLTIQEIQEEDRLWQSKARRRHRKEISQPAEAKEQKSESESEPLPASKRCKAAQDEEARDILRILSQEWRELLVGSEGFLVGKSRAGLEGHNVVWGEMDSMTRNSLAWLMPLYLLRSVLRYIYQEGHVNNVMYIRYAESGRVNWVQNYAEYHDPLHRKEWEELSTPRGHGMILRSIKTDFKFPMSWPDRISVYHKLRSPTSDTSDSFRLDVLILSEKHQRAAARCVEDIVLYDYRRGHKVPMRPSMLEQFSKTWQAQEEATRKNEAKIEGLLERVRRLEERDPDKAGAAGVDLGGS